MKKNGFCEFYKNIYYGKSVKRRSLVKWKLYHGSGQFTIFCIVKAMNDSAEAISKASGVDEIREYDGTNTVLREAEEITAAIRALVGNEESPQELITLKPKYTAIADRYTVTVQHVNAQGASVGAGQSIEGVQIGKTCTVTAPAIEGYVFGYWMDEAGNTLGYGSSYFMMVSKNTTLKAVYVTDPAEVQAKPAMVLDELYPTTAGDVHKVSGKVTRTIPDGYTLIEQGVLYAKDLENLTDENFRYGVTDGIKRYVSTDTKKNGVVNLHVKVTDDDTVVWFRGYMVVKNESTGELETCWSNIRSRSFAS